MEISEVTKRRIGIAMRIIATGVISDSDYDDLGYNSWNFSYYGKPSDFDVKSKCGRLVADSIIELLESKPTTETD